MTAALVNTGVAMAVPDKRVFLYGGVEDLDKIAGQSAKALGTVVDFRGMEIPPYDVSGLAYEPRAGLSP